MMNDNKIALDKFEELITGKRPAAGARSTADVVDGWYLPLNYKTPKK